MFSRGLSVRLEASRKVIAWHTGTSLNLDALEQHLLHARVKTLKRIPYLVHGKPRAIPKREEAVIFTLTNEMGDLGPSAILDALMKNSRDKRTVVAFADGTLVGWNASRADLALVCNACADAEATGHVTESAKYIYSSVGERPNDDAIDDTLVLTNSSDDLKIPYSFALSQSVKIDVLDMALRPIIASVKDWQKNLGLTGHIDCNVKQLRRTKTQLLAVLDEMNFSHGVQTTPRIFWTAEFQPLRGHYKEARSHLEVDDRFEVLSDRIHAVNEALDYLHDEVHTETNELLTWVIIWLIVIEIALALGLHRRIMRAVSLAHIG